MWRPASRGFQFSFTFLRTFTSFQQLSRDMERYVRRKVGKQTSAHFLWTFSITARFHQRKMSKGNDSFAGPSSSCFPQRIETWLAVNENTAERKRSADRDYFIPGWPDFLFLCCIFPTAKPTSADSLYARTAGAPRNKWCLEGRIQDSLMKSPWNLECFF